jgi:FAD/FMN-containing dehydrogenase
MQTLALASTTETLEGYGMRNRAQCRVVRPTTADQIAATFALARAEGASVGLRGGGCSYGDAALNGGQLVVDTSRMNRVLAWDRDTGEMTVEPGVTIAQLWQHTLADGWWPPVVPGTMAVTVGGAAAANIHGKNNWRDGAFGDHILRFDLLLPSGERVQCSRELRPDLFFAAIGGLGLLGCFTTITLRLRRVYSGLLQVRQTAHRSLAELVAALDAGSREATHAVAWIDTGARRAHLGRGLLKAMREPAAGEDSNPALTLDPRTQPPSPRVAGVFPTRWIPTLGRPLATPFGIRFANYAQWRRGNLPGASRSHVERYVPANFMLNFIPNFKNIYRPGGLIQQQSFVPRAEAEATFRAILQRSQAAGLAPSLAVLKRHRPSPFLLNYLCDGYSLALDYAVPRGREAATLGLMHALNELVAEHGGTFFLPKDSTLTADQFRRSTAAGALERFQQLKSIYDPTELLQSDIYRRVVRPALQGAVRAG